jgi:hypothetical protein
MAAPTDSQELNSYDDADVANTDKVIFSDASDGNKIKKDDAANLAALATSNNVQAYDHTKIYDSGDVARLLDAENIICIETTTGTAGSFNAENTKWEPIRADLETGVIKTELVRSFTIVHIVGNGAGVISIETTAPHNMQVGNLVAISDTTNYNGNISNFIGVTSVISTTEFVVNFTGNTSSIIETAGKTSNYDILRVEATQGFIVDNTDNEKPLITVVDAAQQDVSFPQFTTAGFTIFMNSSGVVEAIKSLDATPSKKIDALQLGFMGGIVGTSFIIASKTSPDQIYQRTISERINEAEAGGKIFPGGVFSAGTTGLTVNMSEGYLYYPGVGYQFHRNEADSFLVPAQTPIDQGAFISIYATGSEIDATAFNFGPNEIDVDNYNPDGLTLESVPATGPQFQIFRIYQVDEVTFVYYGTELFESISEARSRYENETTFVERTTSKIGSFRGYVVARRGITSWSGSVEKTDWEFIPKPEEYSLDRGNPQNKTQGLTYQQSQALLASESTGWLSEGHTTLTIRDISSIVRNVGNDTSLITTILDHDMQVGDDIRVRNTTTTLDDLLEPIITVDSTTSFTIGFSGDADVGAVGTVTDVNRYNIFAGTGQIVNHDVTPTLHTPQAWDDELSIYLPGVPGIDLTKGSIYVIKDINSATQYVSSDEKYDGLKLRNTTLISTLKPYTGFTGSSALGIFSVQDTRIALAAPRIQINDKQTQKYIVKSGADVIESTPGWRFSLNSGEIEGDGLNSENSTGNPNIRPVSQQTNPVFYQIRTTGFNDGSLQTVSNPDVGNYESSPGVISPLSNNNFQVMRDWFEPSTGQFLMQYGTAQYTGAEITDRLYESEEPGNPPGLSNTAFVKASLIVQNSNTTTNWAGNSQQQIIQGLLL